MINKLQRNLLPTLLLVSLLLCAFTVQADGRIKGTGGVSSVSGAGGGGLIPWATLASLATDEQRGLVGFATYTDLDDFTLDVVGGAVNFNNRLELSFARQSFTIKANDAEIAQDKYGLKVRVAGDLLYGSVPQVAFGIEHSRLRDPATARAVGALDDNGTDLYLSAARAWIDGLFHRTSMLNVNLRYSQANQYGLLGYGGDDRDTRVQVEVAAALFLTRSIAFGAEYRQKPDNLSALREDEAIDLFVAWFPSKHISITGAYVMLGEIAGARPQNGFYLSIQGAL